MLKVFNFFACGREDQTRTFKPPFLSAYKARLKAFSSEAIQGFKIKHHPCKALK